MQTRSQQTHQRIQQAALLVFAQSGYQAASVDDICTAAGVSKGAFYHHFPTKQSLFLELLNDWLAALDAQLAAILSESKTVPDALVRMAGMMGSVYQAAGGYLPVFLEFWTQASHDPAVWQAVIAPYRRYQEYFAALVQSGIDEGSLRPMRPDSVARTLVGQTIGLLLQGVLDPQGCDWAAETQNSIGQLVDNMRKEHR